MTAPFLYTPQHMDHPTETQVEVSIDASSHGQK